jgi:hypothetical protein
MAIHPDFPSLKVEVVVDGAPLQEYEWLTSSDENIPTALITKYIKAKPGTNSGIRFDVKPTFKYAKYDLSYRQKIDGINLTRKGLLKELTVWMGGLKLD